MTSYHGGKQIIGKQIASIIHDIYLDNSDWIRGYVEPFCGMLGVYRHVAGLDGLCIDYKAGDLNGSVIEMWKQAQRGWKPPREVSESKYEHIRSSRFQTPDSVLKGYVGHQYSYGGIYFGSYRERYVPKIDHSKARSRVLDIAKAVKEVSFTKGRYTQFSKLKGYIIYCDPPYDCRAQRYMETFDFDAFIEWCRRMAKHNIVLVSNMEKIKRATLLFERQVKNDIERLYIIHA